MLCVLSPAKSLDLTPSERALTPTEPALLGDAERLVKRARRLKAKDLMALMKISAPLAELNVQRFKAFALPLTDDNSKPAALAFAGDTYVGFNADLQSDDDLAWAQDHVAILSGLYGVLRPLDRLHPYRLEMGIRLKTRRGPTLYAFWGNRITKRLNALTEGHADRVVVNCASQEYFKAVQRDKLKGGHLTCTFKDVKDGTPRTIGMVAKRARGAMGRFITTERIDRREGLRDFTDFDFRYAPDLSSETEYVFLRPWRTPAFPLKA